MFKFKKIASVLATTAMLTSTVALAAATTYPAPFVTNGAADVAIVYGSNFNGAAATLDLVGVLKVQDSLNSYLTTTADTTTTYNCGTSDCVLLAKSSDNLNLNNTWSVFTGTIDKDNLPVLLKDGTYVAEDNDEYAFEQKITLGTPTFDYFRDSDYESLVGLDERTPTIGFKMGSNTFLLNYTLDFTTDAESDIGTAELEDIEGSDLPLFGKTYYVSDCDNGTSPTYIGKMTLLDSATTGVVNEGETATVTVGTTSYDVSISSLTTAKARLTINGELTNELNEGDTQKLSDGTFVGIRNIFQRDVSGITGNVEFSLGSGKLEITSASDIKLNDVAVSGVKGYVYRATGSSGSEKINKIDITWTTDEEVFLTPGSELIMPGFETLKFTMGDLIRPTEEKITVDKDGDNTMKITLPIKDGDVSFNLLYNSATTGNFSGLGKATDERLATAGDTTLTFYEKYNGADYDAWFVASYNTTSEAESHLLRAKVSTDTTAGRNETTIDKNVDGSWVEICKEKAEGDTCDIGQVSFTINDINYTSGGNESISITATTGANMNFETIYTTGGLKINLPVDIGNSTRISIPAKYEAGELATEKGRINLTSTTGEPGPDVVWYLWMSEEDYQDKIAGGKLLNFTIDETTGSGKPLQVSQVEGAGSGGSSTTNTWDGQEVGDSTSVYQTYARSDVATRIVHYTKPDEDYLEVYYPSGDSETYGEVFLTDVGTSISGGSGGTTSTIGVPILDSEVSSASGRNLIVVGGSCVNSVAADLLGSSTPLCGADWETATSVGAGSYLIQTFERTGGNVATLVAGYNAGDTQNAATALTTQTVDTSAGKKYTGSTATSITSVTTTA